MEHALDMEAVSAHRGELPRREQKILLLRFYGDMTQAQIGAPGDLPDARLPAPGSCPRAPPRTAAQHPRHDRRRLIPRQPTAVPPPLWPGRTEVAPGRHG